MTVPAPVIVIVKPLIVAGPLTMLSDGASPLLAVALTLKGASP